MKGYAGSQVPRGGSGQLQVRQVYKISNVGTVAGCRVTSGKITRDSKVRVVRDGIVITEDEIASLKRFKDDAKEVAEGYECGVTLAQSLPMSRKATFTRPSRWKNIGTKERIKPLRHCFAMPPPLVGEALAAG